MKRLGVFAVVLVVLALVADFGAKLVVENVAGRALSSQRGVNGPVDVSFAGFPFLLHLKDRSFSGVTVEAENFRSGSLTAASGVAAGTEARLASASLELTHVSIEGDIWSDDAERVVAARSGRGSAEMTGAELNRLVPAQYPVRLTLRDEGVRVTATTPAGEQTVDVPEDAVRIEADGTLAVEAPSPVGAILIPLPALLPGVTFRDVDVTGGRIEVTFTLRDVELTL